jgi:hypothetical protein
LKALQMIKFEQRNKHGIKTTKYLGAWGAHAGNNQANEYIG